MASEAGTDKAALDPAEYLFQKTKFHDCHLTVGDPNTGQVEKIGVVTSDLVAHSTVFRDLLLDSALADPTGVNTHITDVSPEVFKLMLRHVYGGKLPDMSQETAFQLVICADKYNIQPLVYRASELLTTETVQQVFPALHCVAYIHIPDLEKRVVKIVQEQTDELVKSNEFLHLDANCLEFIVKQEKLAITELELWRSVVKWGFTGSDGKSGSRQHLNKPLQHIRLLTLSQDEILKEVMPTNILNPPELVSLLSAVTGGQSLASIGLCSNPNKRVFSGKTNCSNSKTPVFINETVRFNNTHIFSSDYDNTYGALNLKELKEYQSSSTFTITSQGKALELQYFVCKSKKVSTEGKKSPYMLTCNVSVYTTVDGFCTLKEIIIAKGQVLFDDDITFPLKLKNGEFLILKSSCSYNFVLDFTTPHPVYTTEYKSPYERNITDLTYSERSTDHMTVKFKSPLHVRSIKYKY